MTKATKIGSFLCSFITWVFLMTAFAYYADKIYKRILDEANSADIDVDVSYGPGFGVTVAAFGLAFINMFVPFLAREAGTDVDRQRCESRPVRKPKPPRQDPVSV